MKSTLFNTSSAQSRKAPECTQDFISLPKKFLRNAIHALLLAVIAVSVGAPTVAVVCVAGGGEVDSAKEVVARVLAVELTSAVQAEVAANTVGIGRGALAS